MGLRVISDYPKNKIKTKKNPPGGGRRERSETKKHIQSHNIMNAHSIGPSLIGLECLCGVEIEMPLR
jgi:hypothetical protein